ncbi:MAG: hypothetical protein CL675_02405 [Bdellovibrionaceae bacterium]|nr:hypothetical protein [Pseudobdellovibrionaceae bacterium]
MGIIETIEGSLRAKGQNGMAGIWLDEHALVEAARKTREAGFRRFEAISPYPLHGIDDAMNIPRSFIPWVTFVMGLAGCSFGTWLTWWTSSMDWALNVGGKPFFSFPAFIPIMFELTILFGALSSVGVMFFMCGLPKVDPPVIDPALTSHKFALWIPEGDSGYDEAKIEQMFKDLGADEVKKAEF